MGRDPGIGPPIACRVRLGSTARTNPDLAPPPPTPRATSAQAGPVPLNRFALVSYVGYVIRTALLRPWKTKRLPAAAAAALASRTTVTRSSNDPAPPQATTGTSTAAA